MLALRRVRAQLVQVHYHIKCIDKVQAAISNINRRTQHRAHHHLAIHLVHFRLNQIKFQQIKRLPTACPPKVSHFHICSKLYLKFK